MVKSLHKSSQKPVNRFPQHLVCSIGCSNDDPGLTLIYFTARSNVVILAFLKEKKVKIVSFPENIAASDLKLIELMKMCEY